MKLDFLKNKKEKLFRKEHGSITSRPFRKLLLTDQPTNQPTNRHGSERSQESYTFNDESSLRQTRSRSEVRYICIHISYSTNPQIDMLSSLLWKIMISNIITFLAYLKEFFFNEWFGELYRRIKRRQTNCRWQNRRQRQHNTSGHDQTSWQRRSFRRSILWTNSQWR